MMVNLFYAVNSITWIGGWNSSTMNDWVRGSWGCGYYWYIFEDNVEKFAEELYMSIQFVYIHYTCLFIKSMLTSLSSIGDLYTLLCFLKNAHQHFLHWVQWGPFDRLEMHWSRYIWDTHSPAAATYNYSQSKLAAEVVLYIIYATEYEKIAIDQMQ